MSTHARLAGCHDGGSPRADERLARRGDAMSMSPSGRRMCRDGTNIDEPRVACGVDVCTCADLTLGGCSVTASTSGDDVSTDADGLSHGWPTRGRDGMSVYAALTVRAGASASGSPQLAVSA